LVVCAAASLWAQKAPSASELWMQQADERLRSGRKYYEEANYRQARVEFDAAIDNMMKAGQDPPNRAQFETRLDDMIDTIHRLDMAGMGAAAPDATQGFDKAPLEDIVEMTFPVDPRIKETVQSQASTVTSGLPITVNDTVLGYVNYFSNRGHRTIENGLIHAGKYQDMINRIFSEEGVPVELIHLAQAESGFMPRALSKAAAAGMWQFVKFRGNEYGLKQTQFTDDRLDPEMATRAAARHLHDLYNEFGDWYLAIAAYNCGPGVIESAVERTGYADFWELHKRRVLPNETANYVPIILAMTLMAKYPKEYGLEGLTQDPALEYDTLTLNANTNLNLIADLTGLPAAELRDLNPSLLKGTAPEGYQLKVPVGTALQVAQDLEMVPMDKRGTWRMYRVQTGETLAVVGKKFGQSAAAVAKANDLEPSAELRDGQKLLIPAAYKETLAVVPAAKNAKPAASQKKKAPPKKKGVATG